MPASGKKKSGHKRKIPIDIECKKIRRKGTFPFTPYLVHGCFRQFEPCSIKRIHPSMKGIAYTDDAKVLFYGR